jgi:hypothetical protein
LMRGHGWLAARCRIAEGAFSLHGSTARRSKRMRDQVLHGMMEPSERASHWWQVNVALMQSP